MNTNVILLDTGLKVSTHNQFSRTLNLPRRIASAVYSKILFPGIICAMLARTACPTASAQSGLLPVVTGSISVGDFDNDGLPDLLVTGNNVGGAGYSAVILHNLGNGNFQNINAGLTGLSKSAAAWGDYDNDGYLDLITSGMTASLNPVCEIWHNNGNGTFTHISTSIPGLSAASVAWGDYDNDGKLDILICGLDVNGVFQTQIWHNDGNGAFHRISTSMPGVDYGSVAWGDYDNDGYLDILLSGWDGTNPITQIWHNNGNGTFSNINAPLPGLESSSVAWGDYDNDGKLDILLSGNNGSVPVTQIWHNMGNGVFSNINANLPQVCQGVAAWGDYNNDGLLDVLINGSDVNGNYTSQICLNSGNNVFTPINAGLPAVVESAGGFGDFYNNGRLDVILAGWSGGAVAQLIANPTATANTPPATPLNISATPTATGVTLSWSAATDAQTPSSGLSYNLRVGTTPGGSDILCADSSAATGERRSPKSGNVGERTSIPLNLAPGQYYWSVQSVDTSYAGSLFSPEASFTLAAVVSTLPASQIAFTSATLNGTVNPRGATAYAWFEYGTTPGYGSASSPQNLGNGSSSINVSQTLPQLTANTTYYFRIDASNQFGMSYGANQTFTTASNTTPVISSIANVSTALNTPTPPIPFQVSETGVSPGSLVVAAYSANPTLVPPGDLVLGGSGGNCTLTITPATGQSGSTAITLTVWDGVSFGVQSFILSVGAVAGGTNGNGVVTQSELEAVLANYWPNTFIMMTNVTSLGGGVFEFGLTNTAGWSFSVMSSPDSVNWQVLSNQACPVFRFCDPSATNGSAMKFYRLRYP